MALRRTALIAIAAAVAGIGFSTRPEALRRGAQTLNTKEIIPFSAVTGAGKDKILAGIGAATLQIPQ